MFTALLDTSVLWPSLQRDFLLSLAVEGVYRPAWSDAILAELEYSEARKLERRGSGSVLAALSARRLVDQMRMAFDDALVGGWEPLEGSYGLPDPDDEHVVAAAHVAGAGVIVTANLKDFPADRLPAGVMAMSAPDFTREAVGIGPSRSVAALRAIASRSGQRGARRSVLEIVDVLEKRYGMTEAMQLVRVELEA